MRVDEALIQALDSRETFPFEWLEKRQLSFKEANEDTSWIVQLANYLCETQQHPFIVLPFDHTLEAEAFGATVHYDPKYGNRVQEPLYIKEKEIESIQSIDLSRPRVLSTVSAVGNYKTSHSRVCFNITGPATVINMLISPELFFRILKAPEKATPFFTKINEGLILWIKEILTHSVEVISYADPTGDATIIGPNYFREVFGRSNFQILKEIAPALENTSTVFHIHPALAKSLIASGFMAIKKTWLPKSSFPESILEVKSHYSKGLFMSRLNENELVILDFSDEEELNGE